MATDRRVNDPAANFGPKSHRQLGPECVKLIGRCSWVSAAASPCPLMATARTGFALLLPRCFPAFLATGLALGKGARTSRCVLYFRARFFRAPFVRLPL